MNLGWPIAGLSNFYSLWLIGALFLLGCGKKNKHIFSFQNEEQQRKRIPLFTLPLIENISLSSDQGDRILRWNALLTPLTYAGERVDLHGYNLYTFNDVSFIPKMPFFTQECLYKPAGDAVNTYYIVRGVYVFQGRYIEGPSSKVISTIDIDKGA
jgi:hypothetical protein